MVLYKACGTPPCSPTTPRTRLKSIARNARTSFKVAEKPGDRILARTARIRAAMQHVEGDGEKGMVQTPRKRRTIGTKNQRTNPERIQETNPAWNMLCPFAKRKQMRKAKGPVRWMESTEWSGAMRHEGGFGGQDLPGTVIHAKSLQGSRCTSNSCRLN